MTTSLFLISTLILINLNIAHNSLLWQFLTCREKIFLKIKLNRCVFEHWIFKTNIFKNFQIFTVRSHVNKIYLLQSKYLYKQ